jgi:hypothetical protein
LPFRATDRVGCCQRTRPLIADAQVGYGQDHRFKVGVLVRAGQTATLAIPAAFHRVAGLQYAEQAYSVQTPAEADHAVTFTACADHHTPFIGGFFVLEPRCIPPEVRPVGGRQVRQVISFFAGDR